MSYDIGIGVCATLADAKVTVKLDSAMVSKLIPHRPWRQSGTSLLRLDAKNCSPNKPLAVGSEVYVSHDRLEKATPASLDVEGDGAWQPVDLQSLLSGGTPSPMPSPTPKSRSSGRR